MRRLVVALTLALAMALAAGAEVRRVEVPVRAVDDAGEPRARGERVDEALAQAVREVARALVEPEALPLASDAKEWRAVLGAPPRAFAVGVRELPATDAPRGIQLTRIAVDVDADQVARALEARGIPVIAREELPEEVFRIRVDATDWATLARLEEALSVEWAARSVPERMIPGRAWLRVSAPGGPEALLDRMLAAPTEDLVITPLGFEDDVLILEVALSGVGDDLEAFDTAD
ncbi:MAG: hypothetical protein QNK05_14995 [Myxococcota bacterium]|nr:hypothetical protein [Myxococcota bacterium]